jgi:predicted dehydrogenase
MSPPFRWAILGTGGVSRKFVLGLRSHGAGARAARAVVVASRGAENARRFAADFGIPATADYAGAAAHPDVDAVYVATPPSEHELHAGLAIAAGKPVLIEKPFASDADAALRIAEQARAKGVFCMEAMWTRFLPLAEKIRARIAAGDLGELRAFEGAFTGSDVPDPAVSLFDPARGGGALMHRGVYPLSLARHFLGPVTDIRAVGRLGDTGVDEDCALILTHEGGALSTIRAGLRASGTNRAAIFGTKATIEIAPPIYRPFAARMIALPPRRGGTGTGGGGRLETVKEGGFAQGLNQRLARLKAFAIPPGRGISAPFSGNGYGYEAQAVAEAVSQGLTEHPLMPLQESVEIMGLIDEARAQFRRAE